MTAIIILCVIAIIMVAIYFFMTAGKKMPEEGHFLTTYKYAHRGLHNGRYPENTIPAFKNAVEHGYGMELDVRLSSDGKVVVFHDNTLERITGKTGKVEDYTAAELTSMKILGTEYAIPLLEDVFAEVDGKTPILIETKSEGSAGALEPALYEALKGYAGAYAVQSFSPLSIGWFYKNAPNVVRGQLSSFFTEGAEHIAKYKRFMIKHLLTNVLCRPNFISYETVGAGNAVVRRLRRSGIPVLAWTVRSKAEEEKLSPFVDTVIFENYES